LSKVCIVFRVATLRIGELSKRSGVSPELLRAWERRYGLLRPARSPGGLRLYSPADLERVRLMRRHLAGGVAAAEAAALALGAADAETEPASPDALRDELADALDRFDEPRAQGVLDRLLAVATVDALLGDVVMPYLGELGERWAQGSASVGQEHFASGLLRGRLLGLARGWGLGIGPVAVLACLPGELHDLGLIAFGLALRARGWRVVYLGADMPFESLSDAVRSAQPEAVVVSAVDPGTLAAVGGDLAELARDFLVAVGGAAANDFASSGEVHSLTGGPVDEAERLTRLVRARAVARSRAAS
jgi:DNA-binding transcriptional MerR regulator